MLKRTGRHCEIEVPAACSFWIWLLENAPRLRPAVLRAGKQEANEIWLSPISTCGAPALHSKRRIQLPGNLSKWLTQALARAQQAPLTHEIAFAAYQLPLAQDPADRLIAATAIVLDLTLLTADEKLLELPV